MFLISPKTGFLLQNSDLYFLILYNSEKMEVEKVGQKTRFIDWKTKRVQTLWESLLHSSEIKKMIEEADDVDNGLILRILGHSLNKGETIMYLNYLLICYKLLFVILAFLLLFSI
jgi:hypothetical protein